jgi:hypothetical protein
MKPRDGTARTRITLVPQLRWPVLAIRELWWNRERRRRIAQLGKTDRRHPLDEGYVVDAIARQIEEIRNLPEVGR